MKSYAHLCHSVGCSIYDAPRTVRRKPPNPTRWQRHINTFATGFFIKKGVSTRDTPER